MPRQIVDPIAILTARTATGVDTDEGVFTGDVLDRTLKISIDGQAGGDSMVIKVQGSNNSRMNPPDFSAAASRTNQWTYKNVKDQDSTTEYDGTTGITYANADGEYEYEIMNDGDMWQNVIITAYTDVDLSGSITAEVTGFNDC